MSLFINAWVGTGDGGGGATSKINSGEQGIWNFCVIVVNLIMFCIKTCDSGPKLKLSYKICLRCPPICQHTAKMQSDSPGIKVVLLIFSNGVFGLHALLNHIYMG